jgi:hypothetical protein
MRIVLHRRAMQQLISELIRALSSPSAIRFSRPGSISRCLIINGDHSTKAIGDSP